MIKFEIIGLNQSLNGVHSYNFNHIRIGKKNGHLAISALIRDNLISLEVTKENKLIIQATCPFNINENKLKDRANLKVGDLITIQDGLIKIKIIEFTHSPILKLKDHVNYQLDQLMKNEPELVQTLKTIKK